MALSQNKLETYVSPGTSVFVWPCCPLVMWCVQLLLPAQVWPTGLLSLFIQICTANQNTEGFFSFEKWKVFPFDTRLESNHLLHRHAETKPMGEARDPQRQVLLKNTGWVTFNQFHSPVKLLHWQRMLGNPLFFHWRDHNGSFIFLWPLNTWREN